MQELLKRCLEEFKQNHEGDESVDFKMLDYLIARNEKDYLGDSALGLVCNEVDNYLYGGFYSEDPEPVEKFKDALVNRACDEFMNNGLIWAEFHNLLADLITEFINEEEA